jgi:hypothetical protein
MMRAITLWQPWAWAICHAGKRVENRTWRPPRDVIGTRIAIHAGKQHDAAAVQWMRDELDIEPPAAPPRGAIVATVCVRGWATIQGCTVRYDGDVDPAIVDSPWFTGPIGWVLGSVRVLEHPIPCPGAQGLWWVPDTLCQAGLVP